MKNKFLSLVLAAVCLSNTGSIAKSLKNEEILNEVSDEKGKTHSRQDSKKKFTDKSIYLKIGGPIALVSVVAGYLMLGGKNKTTASTNENHETKISFGDCFESSEFELKKKLNFAFTAVRNELSYELCHFNSSQDTFYLSHEPDDPKKELFFLNDSIKFVEIGNGKFNSFVIFYEENCVTFYKLKDSNNLIPEAKRLEYNQNVEILIQKMKDRGFIQNSMANPPMNLQPSISTAVKDLTADELKKKLDQAEKETKKIDIIEECGFGVRNFNCTGSGKNGALILEISRLVGNNAIATLCLSGYFLREEYPKTIIFKVRKFKNSFMGGSIYPDNFENFFGYMNTNSQNTPEYVCIDNGAYAYKNSEGENPLNKEASRNGIKSMFGAAKSANLNTKFYEIQINPISDKLEYFKEISSVDDLNNFGDWRTPNLN